MGGFININGTNKNITYTAENSLIKGKIEFRKIDSQTEEPIQGAEFELYKSTGEPTGKTAVSGIYGLVSFVDVPYGNYIIKETKPANYYKTQNSELKATVSANEESVFAGQDGNVDELFSLENIINTGNFSITKVDRDNDQIKLPGAVFRLFSVNGTTETLIESEKTTDSEGLAIWEDLRFGNYVLREVSSPDGYYLNTNGLTFELSDETLDFSAILNKSFDNAKIPLGNLVINKIDSYTGKPIANVEFAI